MHDRAWAALLLYLRIVREAIHGKESSCGEAGGVDRCYKCLTVYGRSVTPPERQNYVRLTIIYKKVIHKNVDNSPLENGQIYVIHRIIHSTNI